MYCRKKMQKAIDHALNNPIQKRGRTAIGRMSALITAGDEDYLGWNQYKSHPEMFKWTKDHNKICLHAELDALVFLFRYGAVRAWQKLDRYDCYVSRVLANDTVALAKPCPACLGALQFYGIRKIYWTTNSKEIGDL